MDKVGIGFIGCGNISAIRITIQLAEAGQDWVDQPIGWPHAGRTCSDA